MDIKTLGIDIGKNKFHLFGVNEKGEKVIRKDFTRKKLFEFMANLKTCLIGMEACGGAHHLARTLKAMGHDVRLMAIQHVKPYTSAYKNDFNDARGICEAVGRPLMSFVSIKTVEQQEIIAIHNDRQRLIRERTALANDIRAFLMEMGIIIPQGIHKIAPVVKDLLDPESEELSPLSKDLLKSKHEEFENKFTLVAKRDKQLLNLAKADSKIKKLMDIPGYGIITASAFVAKVGDPNAFENGRQLSAWLGMVPSQHSTGGKTCLGSISKRGDSYLRSNAIHGSRSVYAANKNKPREKLPPLIVWFLDLAERRGKNKAIVAFANKMMRIGWAILAHDSVYDENYGKKDEIMVAA
jgi:transposase